MSDIYDTIGDFDPYSVPVQDYSPVPAGWHPAMIAEAEVVDTKAGNGKLLKLKFSLIGAHEGRVLFARINLANPNPKCVEIGQRELAALAMAAGIARPKDSAEFVDRVVEIKVKVTDLGGEPSNEVCGYRAQGAGNASAAPKASRAQAPSAAVPPVAAAPAATRKRPWER